MSEAAPDQPHIADVDAFRAWAEGRPERWQFIDGALVMMAGASMPHVRITSNLNGLLWAALRGRRCQPYPADLAVRVSARNDYYPDIVVDCGPVAGRESTEPVAVIEVLSPSTEADDRGRKWKGYRTLPSLRSYVLMAQDRMSIELFTRSEDETWRWRELALPDAVLRLPGLEVALRLEEIYEGVVFEEAESADD